jgi:hypothetical protein
MAIHVEKTEQILHAALREALAMNTQAELDSALLLAALLGALPEEEQAAEASLNAMLCELNHLPETSAADRCTRNMNAALAALDLEAKAARLQTLGLFATHSQANKPGSAEAPSNPPASSH